MAEAEKKFDLNDWMLRTGRIREVKGPEGYVNAVVKALFPRIHCADGFELSVQASRTHHCTPRDDFGPYSAVEVGYPSAFEELLTNPENQSKPLETVYPWTSVETVEKIIDKHGGLADANRP